MPSNHFGLIEQLFGVGLDPRVSPQRRVVAQPGSLPSASARFNLKLPLPDESSRRLIPAVVSASAMLFLGIVSGAPWKTDAGAHPVAVSSRFETAVSPAAMTPIVPAPETIPGPQESLVTGAVRGERL
jgi:hypothetical protein